jgi:transketolase
MPMGMADVATVLFNRFIRIDPSMPDWADRDRFVLSAGHGSMLIYAIHHLIGYSDMTIDQLRHFRQLGVENAGHPEYGHTLGDRDHHRDRWGRGSRPLSAWRWARK